MQQHAAATVRDKIFHSLKPGLVAGARVQHSVTGDQEAATATTKKRDVDESVRRVCEFTGCTPDYARTLLAGNGNAARSARAWLEATTMVDAAPRMHTEQLLPPLEQDRVPVQGALQARLASAQNDCSRASGSLVPP